ncbi:fatty acid desaturase family protein [Mucilaginibacter gotjawali]|uniref:Linoleoyl-CoA desaturase n=1 Tax=Mucilaginibacter gotjawali TaxID=1550579 RepID=A0A839SDT9_9SPHI|nr:acyl-CoA desaturase [Mucilaginibacter gotjawali]MBB3054717.1 linoleoyl-CoA desaturase [Mucilaginibacter gotjawali]
MQTIKFSGDAAWQKQFAAAVRHNVNKYFKDNGISTKGNFILLTQTVAMLSCYIVPLVMLLTFRITAWLALPMVIIMGIGMAGIGMCVMHDAVHGSYSDKEWINKLMGGTMYLLGSNVFNWKIQHNVMHHAYTNIEGYDEDIAVSSLIRLSQFAPAKRFYRYQHIHAFFFYGLMTISKLTTDFVQLARYNKEGITRKFNVNPTMEYAKMVFVKVLYLLVFIGLPLLITHYTWWQVLSGFFIMHWTAGFIMSTIFQMAHVVEGAKQFQPDKDGIIHTEWAVNEVLTTSDFARNNGLLNWYVGGLNFQIEHHLFPNVCHVHYHNIAPIVEKTAKEYGLFYNLKPTFMNALASHVSRLKELGRQTALTV